MNTAPPLPPRAPLHPVQSMSSHLLSQFPIATAPEDFFPNVYQYPIQIPIHANINQQTFGQPQVFRQNVELLNANRNEMYSQLQIPSSNQIMGSFVINEDKPITHVIPPQNFVLNTNQMTIPSQGILPSSSNNQIHLHTNPISSDQLIATSKTQNAADTVLQMTNFSLGALPRENQLMRNSLISASGVTQSIDVFSNPLSANFADTKIHASDDKNTSQAITINPLASMQQSLPRGPMLPLSSISSGVSPYGLIHDLKPLPPDLGYNSSLRYPSVNISTTNNSLLQNINQPQPICVMSIAGPIASNLTIPNLNSATSQVTSSDLSKSNLSHCSLTNEDTRNIAVYSVDSMLNKSVQDLTLNDIPDTTERKSNTLKKSNSKIGIRMIDFKTNDPKDLLKPMPKLFPKSKIAQHKQQQLQRHQVHQTQQLNFLHHQMQNEDDARQIEHATQHHLQYMLHSLHAGEQSCNNIKESSSASSDASHFQLPLHLQHIHPIHTYANIMLSTSITSSNPMTQLQCDLNTAMLPKDVPGMPNVTLCNLAECSSSGNIAQGIPLFNVVTPNPGNITVSQTSPSGIVNNQSSTVFNIDQSNS